MTDQKDCDTALPIAGRNMRVGLLGGSFDPPHEGHRNISLAALKALGLDQVWWLVSPTNPLKAIKPWPLQKRIRQCERKAAHPRIRVTGFECGRDSFYTVDSLKFLKRRFGNTDFVWIMGADNLKSIHHWYRWHDIFSMMPVLVMDRPGYRFAAFSAQARYFYREYQVGFGRLGTLPGHSLPSWAFMTLPLSEHSSTGIRNSNAIGMKGAET